MTIVTGIQYGYQGSWELARAPNVTLLTCGFAVCFIRGSVAPTAVPMGIVEMAQPGLPQAIGRYTAPMHSRRVQHWAILALLVALVAMVFGGGATGSFSGARETASAASSVTSSVRLPDVMVRANADREDSVLGKLSASRSLFPVALSVSSLLALLARVRRQGRRGGEARASLSPLLDHSVLRRGPPVLRLIQPIPR